jgi:hypothetical protein
MRVALLSESSADEAALQVLIEAILGEDIEVEHVRARSRGWKSVFKHLGDYLKGLHFQTRADGVVIVIDSDDSELHDDSHGEDLPRDQCRLCDLTRDAENILNRLKPVDGRSRLKVATGLACPLIEAWWSWLDDKRITEAGLRVARQGGRQGEYNRIRLKTNFYGVARPDLAHETEAMVKAARRLCGQLDEFERFFPGGFAPLRRSLKAWK